MGGDKAWRSGGVVGVRIKGELIRGHWELADPGLIRVWYGARSKTTQLGKSADHALASILFRELVERDLPQK
jgi:hypothetical protein